MLPLLAHRHQTVVAQHLEVLRDGRLTDAEFGDEIAHADLAIRGHTSMRTLEKSVQKLASGAVREHVEDVGHPFRVARRAREYHGVRGFAGLRTGRQGDRMRANAVRRDPLRTRIIGAVGDFAASTPARFAILIFAGLIAVFTLLFSLPIATASGEPAPFVDAFFTAVSTICVTGLSTVDMATYWSPFGHVFVFIGVEIGGIGVLTLASILGLVISRKLGLRQKLIAASDANPMRIRRGPVSEGQAVRLGETGSLLATVAISVLVIEGITAALLFPRMLLQSGDVWSAAWQSVYLSAMAFTNTGFTPTSEGLAPFASDPYFLIVMMLAVGLGAIGFPVIYVLRRNLVRPRRWSLHVKITLVTFIGLLRARARSPTSSSSSTTRRRWPAWTSANACCRASSSRRWRDPAASRLSTWARSTARACWSPTCSCSSAEAPPRPRAASR